VTLLALDVRHETDAAGIVLVGRVVQTLLLDLLLLGCRGHGASFSVQGHKNKNRGTRSLLRCNKNAKTNKWGQIPIIHSDDSLENNWGHINNRKTTQ
jgi:hypothetical protein